MTVRELRITYHKPAGSVAPSPIRLSAPHTVARWLRSVIGHETVEVFLVLCLNTRNGLIGYHEVSRGTLNETLVHPREVFKVAILANAASVILAHNHPSGDPDPSPNDRNLTARLVGAGELMGIDVLDHIIVGEGDRYVSFRDTELLKPKGETPWSC